MSINGPRKLSPTRVALLLIVFIFGVSIFIYQMYFAPRALAASPNIVISQIYGGGGNTGAPLRNDFIEIFNRGTSPVNLSGWSVQYTSATGTGNFAANVTTLSGTLNPGQYYLVQEGSGGANGVLLPTPDASGSIAMSATGGKVIVANIATGLACNGGSTQCSATQLANIVDLIGYDGANFFEAAPAPTLSSTTAVVRDDFGCTDTDDNSADFASAVVPVSPDTPNPRNTSSGLHPCSGPPSIAINDVTVTEGHGGTTTASFTVSLSSPAPLGGVTFDIATQDDSATIADGDYLSNSLVGQTIMAGNQSYTFDVTVNGDTNIESNESFFVNLTNVVGASNTSDQGVGTITNDDFAPPVFDVVISQVYGGGGNSGATLRNDFIELFNRGTTTVNLEGWSVQYNSATGTGTWQVTSLTGSIAPGGYYLVQEAAGAGGTTNLPTPDAVGSIAMGAAGGKVALRSNSSAITGACAAGGDLIDLVGYGTTTCFEGTGPTNPTSNTTAAVRKRGGCLDTNNNGADFSIGSPNPRNTATPTRTCGYISAPIHDIQGTGPSTPFLGQDMMTTGIISGRKTNGFFIQEPDVGIDPDPNTSEAIFVFTSTTLPGLAVGDFVTVKGTAGEFFNLTQLDSTLPGDVVVSTSGNPLPAPIVLTTTILNPAGPTDQLERFEGMRMHADSLTSVAPTNNFGEIFTALTGVPRPMREPGIEVSLPVPPDPTSAVVDCCIPRWDENPERIMIDSDGLVGSSVVSVTSNVIFSNITGPLDFTFGNYKVLPETSPSTTANMSAVPVPTPVAGEFTVAGYNIENFNNSATQRQKAALAIRTVLHYPDVIGHIEISDLASLQALATQVNNDALAAGDPNPAYEARLIPAPAGGTQNVGFLVKTARVQIDSVTQERASDTFINPNNGMPETLHDRPPLVLQATVDPTGINPRQVIVIVNHLRSFIDIELVSGDGPRVRAKRTAQAESIADLLQDLQTAHSTLPVISIGDYNAYQFNDGYTDPISVIKGTPTSDDQVVVDQSPDLVNPNFTNLTDGLPANERYSFIFEGTPQALDHVLVNTVANSYVQRYAVARNNADFPELPASLFAGDVTRPERNSDHDMPVAYFAFPPPSADLSIAKTATSPVAAGSNITYSITVTNSGVSPAQNVVVADNLPAGTTFVSCSSTGSGVCGGSGNNRTVTFSSMASGVSASITILASVDCDVPNGTSLSNTATVSSDTGDPDTNNNSQTASTTVSNPPPTISGVSVDKPVLWPPNHQMVDVTVNYSGADDCGAVICTLSVTSNEPVDGDDDGSTSPDWEVVDNHHVRLRAERSGLGTGRIYTITITCTDAAGGTTTKTVTVSVPLNMR